MAILNIYITAVGGLLSGMGATPATALHISCLTRSDIKTAVESNGSANFIFMDTGWYEFRESGATGDEANALIEDVGNPSGYVCFLGANAQGVVDGTKWRKRAIGTWNSSGTRYSMISHQFRRRMWFAHHYSDADNKAYNNFNNAAIFANSPPDTSAAPTDLKLIIYNYEGHNAYHNDCSIVGGRPAVPNPCTRPGGGGVFFEKCYWKNSGITGGGFAAIVARGGTNLKVLSGHWRNCRFENCCAGIQVNADGAVSPQIVEDCVFDMNTTGATQTGRAVQFTKPDAPVQVHRCIFNKGNTYDLAIDLYLPGSVVTNCEFSNNTNSTGTPAAIWAYNRESGDGYGARVIGCNFYNNSYGTNYVLATDDGIIDAALHTGSTTVDPSYTNAATHDFSRSAAFIAGATSGGGMAGRGDDDDTPVEHLQLPVTPGRPRLRNRVA